MINPAAFASKPPSGSMIQKLGHLCNDRGLPDLATRLSSLSSWISLDMRSFEEELSELTRGPRIVQLSAHHLLDLGGKHLRPMCVALAARMGDGFGPSARKLAVAVELVHNATLLHDDVIDVGDVRRGSPTARTIYGNAASIYAGDWLLVHALKNIRATGYPGLLDHMLDIIDEMILAESLQLERRGKLRVDTDGYFRVVEGKTASLFRWALFAGARAGGLGDTECEALQTYGAELGVAFQLIDDLLDFDSQPTTSSRQVANDKTGKALFADLREGKVTFPLLLALERDRDLLPLLERWLSHEGEPELPDTVARSVAASLKSTGALADCRVRARQHIDQAIAALDCFPDSTARASLITVAEATSHRER